MAADRAFFLALLLLTLVSGIRGIKKHITCHAGAFAPGQAAKVTCNLYTVDEARGRDIHMVRFSPGAPDSDTGTDIVFCQWDTTSRRHKCKVASGGYALLNNNQSRPDVTMPDVTKDMAGLYMCSVLPTDGTYPQACELFVKEGISKHETSTSDCKDSSNTTWIAVLTVTIFFGIGFLAAFSFVLFKMNKKKRSTRTIGDHAFKLLLRNTYTAAATEDVHDPENNTPAPREPRERVKSNLGAFSLTDDDLRNLKNRLDEDLNNFEAKYKFPVPFVPPKEKCEDVLAVVLKSYMLKVMIVKHGAESDQHDYRTYRLTPDVRVGPGKQLMKFIAERVKQFAEVKHILETKMPVGFVLPFPLTYDTPGDLTSARLVHWTKGFSCKGVVGKLFRELLQSAVEDAGLKNTEIKAIVNDVVALAISSDTGTVAVNISNGFNACYKTDTQIMNTEIGSVGNNSDLEKMKTDFDKETDRCSVNPGQYVFEKMIGKLYLGEVTRHVLLDLIKKGLLFDPLFKNDTLFHDKHGFNPEFAALFARGQSTNSQTIKELLQFLDIDHYDEDDCVTITYVCRTVYERSARLAAAALAAIVKRVGKKEVTIAIDGSLYRNHESYRDLLERKTKELVGDECQITFLHTPGASGVGAAIAALSTTKRESTTDPEQI